MCYLIGASQSEIVSWSFRSLKMRIAAALMVWVLSTSEIVDADQHPLISSPKERIVLKAAAFHVSRFKSNL